MPWGEKSTMSLRREFVMLASQEGANIRALCRGFEIQPRIGYKWLARYRAQGEAGLADRPRRPRGSPARTPAAAEAKVVELRLK
ncbi:MAG TPA: helix-turn-helix domain-containing protein, partial [Dongiaceae bacterium]|nr:helix-turn-helix domain-containing protein [Dongiaceae bacterium]